MAKNYKLLSGIVAAGHNLGTFAEETGISVGTLSNIVNGHRKPHADTLRAICAALDTPAKALGLQAYDPFERDFSWREERRSKER
jgi:transcriptional regulator with XRE-family HTH domain